MDWAFRMPMGVSIMHQSAMLAGAPALSMAATRPFTVSASLIFGTRMASAPDFAMAAMSSAPQGVSSPLMRTIISRLP